MVLAILAVSRARRTMPDSRWKSWKARRIRSPLLGALRSKGAQLGCGPRFTRPVFVLCTVIARRPMASCGSQSWFRGEHPTTHRLVSAKHRSGWIEHAPLIVRNIMVANRPSALRQFESRSHEVIGTPQLNWLPIGSFAAEKFSCVWPTHGYRKGG